MARSVEAAAPAESDDAMNTEEFLHDYYRSWGTSDPKAVIRHFTDQAVFEDLAFSARFEGHDGIESFVLFTYQGAPDFEVEPVNLIVTPEAAAAEWVMSGTHSGDLPGLPATGKRFEVRASSVIELREGLIHRIVDYWNLDSFRKSVGLL